MPQTTKDLQARYEQLQRDYYEANAVINELVVALQEMMTVYWGNGDGGIEPPGCILRAERALAKAEAAL